MEKNKAKYVTKPEKDFTRNRKITFYDMMWFLLFIGANSMTEEIRRAFIDKAFYYISEAAIPKNRSKIKVSAFEQLFHKYFSSLYSVNSEYAIISNQYGGSNRMHINFAYDILNKNFLDCVIEAKNKTNERKGAIKMLSCRIGKDFGDNG